MGRSIPSGTSRVNSKLADWERFSRLLPRKEAEAFRRLAAHMRNRRNAIEAADEADIGVSMLLAVVTMLEMKYDVSNRLEHTDALPGPDGDGGP